jgi:hypothetical protein
LQNWGIDVSKAADRLPLTTPISSPAVIARFPYLANPNNVYPGFPGQRAFESGAAAIPAVAGYPAFPGPAAGRHLVRLAPSQAAQTLPHGLDVQAAFTWQKELNNGVTSDTSYFTPGTVLINDVRVHGGLRFHQHGSGRLQFRLCRGAAFRPIGRPHHVLKSKNVGQADLVASLSLH